MFRVWQTCPLLAASADKRIRATDTRGLKRPLSSIGRRAWLYAMLTSVAHRRQRFDKRFRHAAQADHADDMRVLARKQPRAHARIAIRPLVDPTVARTVGLIRRCDAALSPIARDFHLALRRMAPFDPSIMHEPG